MHRNGTSLCSSVLHALGIDMANDRWVDRGNEHGHWERVDIVEVQDTILNITSRPFYSPTHDFPMPSGWWRRPEIHPHVTRLKAMVTEVLRETDTFGFKDPRTVKLIPFGPGFLPS